MPEALLLGTAAALTLPGFTNMVFPMVPDPVFQAALQTQSSVKGHDDCAGCPNRGTSRCDDADECR